LTADPNTYSGVFDVPVKISQPGIVINRGAFPGLIIIGDPQSFLHKRTIVRPPDK
jgi:hypothetical protein